MGEAVLSVLGDAMGKAVLDGVMGETLNRLLVTALVILIGGVLVIGAWLVLRFGKVIGLGALILGILVVAVLGAGTLTGQSATDSKTTQAATSEGAMLCTGGLGALALISTGAAGVFYARLRLAERWPTRSSQLNCHWPRRQRQPDGPVVYIIQSDPADVEALDLWEVDEWTQEESLQLWH